MNTLPEDASSLKGKQGVARIVAAGHNSLRGLRDTWRHEAAFRQECYLFCVFFPAAFWLGQNAFEIAVLLMSCFLVLMVELLNTAVEATIDRVGMEHHPLSGRAKDVASAAVLLSLVQVVVVWSLVAWNRFA